MKSGNINRLENLGCTPLTLKMCLSILKQYLVRDRADSTCSESASSTDNRAQMVVEGFFSPSVIYHIFISVQQKIIKYYHTRQRKVVNTHIWENGTIECLTWKMAWMKNGDQNRCQLTSCHFCVILCCNLLYLCIPPWIIKNLRGDGHGIAEPV